MNDDGTVCSDVGLPPGSIEVSEIDLESWPNDPPSLLIGSYWSSDHGHHVNCWLMCLNGRVMTCELQPGGDGAPGRRRFVLPPSSIPHDDCANPSSSW